MTRPNVSVVIPTFNRAALLPRAIESVVAQTFDDWEIVLVDDGSTDDTPQVAARCSEQIGDRFVYIRQPNLGSSAARNRGIDASLGRFVAFLDSDDEFLPHKFERQLAVFDARPGLGFVYSDFAFVDLKGVRSESAFDSKFPISRTVPCEPIAPGLYECTADLFGALIRGYFIATIVGLVRRDALGADIRFAENLRYAEERLFYLRLARRWRAGFVDEPLALHHFVEASLTRTDKHRNTHDLLDLLKAVRSAFPDLRPELHRALNRQIADTCRQLGYDAHAAGRLREALTWFSSAARHHLSVPAVGELAGAGLRWITSAAAHRTRSGLRVPTTTQAAIDSAR